jgi:CRP-like cAMP-binding protein
MSYLHLIDKAFFLKKTELFSALDLDLLLTIADKMEEESYKKGMPLFLRSSDANFMYFIVKGKVRLNFKNNEFTLGENESFGEEAILSGKPRTFDATCVTDVVCLILSPFHLMSILTQCPQVTIALLESYAQNVECRTKSKTTSP